MPFFQGYKEWILISDSFEHNSLYWELDSESVASGNGSGDEKRGYFLKAD